MSGKPTGAESSAPTSHPKVFPDTKASSAPIPPDRPTLRAPPPVPHAEENPANNCTPSPSQSNWETPLSTPAPPPSAAPRQSTDPPAADTHPKADKAPVAAHADCSKDSPPSNSPAKSPAPPATSRTISLLSNPSR